MSQYMAMINHDGAWNSEEYKIDYDHKVHSFIAIRWKCQTWAHCHCEFNIDYEIMDTQMRMNFKRMIESPRNQHIIYLWVTTKPKHSCHEQELPKEEMAVYTYMGTRLIIHRISISNQYDFKVILH